MNSNTSHGRNCKFAVGETDDSYVMQPGIFHDFAVKQDETGVFSVALVEDAAGRMHEVPLKQFKFIPIDRTGGAETK